MTIPATNPTTIHRRQLLLGTAGLSLLALAGCSESEAQTNLPEAAGSASETDLFADLPIEDVIEGDPDAPVTVIEYASMTCGHCRAFHEETYPTIKAEYVDTGRARFILREFPFDPRSAAAFMLARCAPNGQRDAMIGAMFETQDSWARAENAQAALFDVARLAGFTEESFRSCLTDQALTEKIFASFKKGEELGVNSTPTFFIDGQRYAGNMDAEAMGALIDAALAS